MNTIRTFIAVELSPSTRQRVSDLVNRLTRSQAKVKWVVAEQMHLTLKFLGDVVNTSIPEVCQAVAQAAAKSAEFEIQCVGAGAFPDVTRPRTVWVGVGTGQAELIELQESIERSLNPLGFPRENRRFHAHLTIGRVRSAGPQSDLAKLIQEQAAFEAGTTIVDEVVTFASYLDKTGPTYEALGRAPLNG